MLVTDVLGLTVNLVLKGNHLRASSRDVLSHKTDYVAN